MLTALTFQAPAQNLRLIDSLKNSLKNAAPMDQFEILNSIGFEFRYSSPDSTIYYCNKAFELGNRIGMQKTLSRPLSFIGLAKSYGGHIEEALRYHNQAISMAVLQQDTVQMAHGYNNLGRLFFDQGDVVRAYANFVKAGELFNHIHDSSGAAYVYRSLASLFKSKQDYSKALVNSRKALELRKRMGDPRATASAYMELGLVYAEMDSTSHALLAFHLAETIAAAVHDKVTEAEVHVGIAEVFLVEQRLEEALSHVREVFKYINRYANQRIYLRARLVEAQCLSLQHNAGRAIPILQQILTSAEKSGNHIIQRDAAKYLALAYREVGNAMKFREADDLYQILDAKIRNADLNKEIERLQFQLLIEKAELENASLRSRQAQDETLISRQRLQNIVLGLIVIFLGILTVIFFRVSARRKRMNTTLEEQNQRIIAQRKAIEIQNLNLSQANTTLDAINHEKDALMNIVAHDLKSPLSRIQGLTQLLEIEGKSMSSSQQEYIDHIRNSTKAGLDLITNLLDVHALEQSADVPKPGAFSLGQLIAEKIQLFGPAAEAKQITLDSKCEAKGLFAGSQEYIGRILDNLMSNAVKFTPLGTAVKVSGSWIDPYLIISVSDSGPGFSAQDREMMFRKFKRLSARPTAGESSNGLGLAIVKTLVDRLNGSIDLETSPAGSKFIVRIPVQKIS
ncbi:MAG: tetratricopeptide repeat-containing sensor histidine kinase [Bacteroidetes bacterium]|nr:tetratricopeptide repeat-containing sensor histidine kinase [Bacteroidota bacterium]